MSAHVPVIEIKRATKKFGDFTAVGNASFRVFKGDIVGFVGANGAGKTTTIGMLLGFIKPTEGIVKLFTDEITPANAHKSHKKIGYAAGDMELPARLTGRQYLDFVLYQAGGDHQEQYKKLVKRFMPELNKKIHELSRGNKQKIALIAAFLHEPELVVLDEPTSGLDPVMQEEFLELIREYKSSGGTVFMSSHYLQEVVDVCSRVILMRKGVLIQDTTTDELLGASGKYVTVVSGYKHTNPPKGSKNRRN